MMDITIDVTKAEDIGRSIVRYAELRGEYLRVCQQLEMRGKHLAYWVKIIKTGVAGPAPPSPFPSLPTAGQLAGLLRQRQVLHHSLTEHWKVLNTLGLYPNYGNEVPALEWAAHPGENLDEALRGIESEPCPEVEYDERYPSYLGY